MIGRKVAQYEVLSLIGEGGMGQVYRARDERLERDVALKVLPPEFTKDPERLARFRREARLLASLNHPNIAALHGLEEVDGEVFLVMELVDGEDLSVRLRRGALELEDALDLARQFAEGLEAAHEQSIVHRDLKPANLKVNAAGQLKILDFGLARAYLGDGGEAENLEASPTITAALTGHGVILGTAAYMSPEQARGKAIDQRTDIWAFGAILFEMLCGQRIFAGETISDTMAAVLRAEPPWGSLPESTPRGVVRLLERCLERDGRRRLRDIGEARVRLERWREDPSAMHESYISGVQVPAEIERSRAWLPWSVAGLAILLAVAMGWWTFGRAPVVPIAYDMPLGVVDGAELGLDGTSLALSPDGRWMAWMAKEGVWVRRFDDPEPRLLEGTASTNTFTFSPDSRWVAVTLTTGLHRVSVSGGMPIFICESSTPRGVTWVDASTIVLSPTISSGLLQVDLRTGESRPLTEIDNGRGERSHRWPSVIPGTRKVLFTCQFIGRDYDDSDIEVVDLDDPVRRVVHRGGTAPRASGRGHLFFVRGSSLFAIPFDEKAGETTGLAVAVRAGIRARTGNQEDHDGSAQYTMDSRGTLLYVEQASRAQRLNRIAWMDLRTGDLEFISTPSNQEELVLSPDGNRAVVRRFLGQDENLFAVDMQTRAESQLTFRESVEYAGAWSPDSRTYYWSQSSDSGDRFEIWRRPVDGSQPAEFVVSAPEQSGIWPTSVSPDGRWLFAGAWVGGGRDDVYVLDLEAPDTGLQKIVATVASERAATWIGSDYFLYRDHGSGGETAEITLRRFPDTGAQWRLPEEAGGYYLAVPEPDLTGIITVSSQGLTRHAISLDGGMIQIGASQRLRTWTPLEFASLDAVEPHPDGERLLVLWAEGASEEAERSALVMVTDWWSKVDAMLEAGI